MTIRALHRGILWVGLVGSFVFVFVGTWTLASRVWARSFTQTLEVLVAAPFLAIWVLSPILWAAWPRREPPRSRTDSVIALWAAALVVGVSAYVYLSELVVLPLLFDIQPRLRSLILVLALPGLQWGILGAAGALQLFLGRSPTEEAAEEEGA